MYSYLLKPILDFILALIGFLLLSPLFLMITICLMIANQGKPFFLQARPGKNAKIFNIIKFKTMNDKLGPDGILLPGAERITPFGRLVRKTSMDEIPQLLNVLIGDMSLIGPRPLLPEYLQLYNTFQARRHELKPGITGWAQVNGRNTISWQQKFEYDVWYVDNVSLRLDIKIILLTLKKVVFREGINSKTSITMEKFIGS